MVPQLRVRLLSGAVVYEGPSFLDLEALRVEVARVLPRPEELVFCRGDSERTSWARERLGPSALKSSSGLGVRFTHA
jgi:hypothetical protein